MFFSFLSDVLFVAELLGCKIRDIFSNIQFIEFKILFNISFFLILLQNQFFLRKK